MAARAKWATNLWVTTLLLLFIGAWWHGQLVVADEAENSALSLSNPAPGAYDSSIVILSSVDGTIHALEAETGEIRWTLSSGGSIVNAAKAEKPDPVSKDAVKAGSESAGTEEVVGPEEGKDDGVEKGAQSAALQKREPKRNLLTGEEEDAQDMPEIIPSYERGGGLWLYHEGKLKRVEMTASQIVDASPFVGEDGFIYVGRKRTNLFAVDPNSGKASWVHLAELDNPTCGRDDSGAETLIISRSEYTLHARDARTGLQNWNVTIAEFMAHGTVQSQDFALEHELPLLVVSDGQEGRVVRCHDARSGALRWSRLMPSAPVCAHVWAEQRAVELPLYSETDFAEQHEEAQKSAQSKSKEQTISSIFLGQHQGTLFARPSPRPALADKGMVARLRAKPRLPQVAEGDDPLPPSLPPSLPPDPLLAHLPPSPETDASTALVHSAYTHAEPASRLTEQDGALTSELLARCNANSADYPACLIGSHVMEVVVQEEAGNCQVEGGVGVEEGGAVHEPPIIELRVGEGEEEGGWVEAMLRKSNLRWMLAGFLPWPVAALMYWLYARRSHVMELIWPGRAEAWRGDGGLVEHKVVENGSAQSEKGAESGGSSPHLNGGGCEPNGESKPSRSPSEVKQAAKVGERRSLVQPPSGEWSSADEDSEVGSVGDKGKGKSRMAAVPSGTEEAEATQNRSRTLSLDTSTSNGSPVFQKGRNRSRFFASSTSLAQEDSDFDDKEESRDTFTDDSQYDSRRFPRPRSWNELDTFGGPNAFKSICAQLDEKNPPELSRDTSWTTDDDEPRGRSISLGSHMSASLQKDLDGALNQPNSAPSSPKAMGTPGSSSVPREARNSNDWNESRYAQDFIQLEKLGKGGFGSVFKARQRLDMREYAVKKVRLENDPRSPNNQRVIREVRNMATLSHHPNIVRYYGTWQETIIPDANDPLWGEASMSLEWTLDQSGTLGEETQSEHIDPPERITLLYIQMELCTTSLRHMLTNDAMLTPEQTHQYMMDVAEGLMHVHSERYIHRDIKPDNIFIVHDVAKIGDFGLSCRSTTFGADGFDTGEGEVDESVASDSLNELTRGVGTHLYASPELDKGTMYDEKVDMYALGIVLFEMLIKFGTRMERIDVVGKLKAAMAMPQCQRPMPLPKTTVDALSQPDSPLSASVASSRRESVQDSLSSTPRASVSLGGTPTAATGGSSGGKEPSALSLASTTEPVTVSASSASDEWELRLREALPGEMLRLERERPVEAALVLSLMALHPASRPSARTVRDKIQEQRPYDPHEEMRKKDSYIQELKAQLQRQSSGRQLQLDIPSARRVPVASRREESLRKSHSQSPKVRDRSVSLWASSSSKSGAASAKSMRARAGLVQGKISKSQESAVSSSQRQAARGGGEAAGGGEGDVGSSARRAVLQRSITDPGGAGMDGGT